MKKKLLLLIMTLTLLLSMGVAVKAAETKPDENKCGKNATWTFDTTSKTLTINGTGLIKNSHNWEKLNVKHVVINKGITTIGRYTFNGLKTIEDIDIPTSVTSIGTSAFARTGVTEMTIGSNVSHVGPNVFYKCRKLKSVRWNATYIPSWAFEKCKALTNVYLSKNTTSIGNYAFYNTSITQINLPDSITQIGKGAFEWCNQLTGITIPGSVSVIRNDTFSYSKKLGKIVIKNGVKKISGNAFYRVPITSLDLPDSITTISSRAFNGAYQLASIKLPKNLKAIYKNTFKDCASLQKVKMGPKIKYIGEFAFTGCKKLGKVVIPGSVQSIGYGAFQNSGCTEVYIKDGVKLIDYWAFNNCPNLKSIYISGSVKTICANALVDCKNLKNIIVSKDNVKYTSEGGCLLSKNGTTLYVVSGGTKGTFQIPSSVTKIGGSAFSGCYKISNIKADYNSNFTSEDGILYDNSKKTLVKCPASKKGVILIPNGVVVIEESAFQQSKASYIYIPDSVKYIGYCAFEYCKNIKSVKIPGSVTKVSNAAFWGCENLKRVTIEKGVKKIQRNAFHDCNKLRKVTIPSSVVKISKSAFEKYNGVTFYCKKSSAAMSYAVKYYGIDYMII